MGKMQREGEKVGEGRENAEAVQEAQMSTVSVRAIETPELSQKKKKRL